MALDPGRRLAGDARPLRLYTPHLYTQIVGKIRLVDEPLVNHCRRRHRTGDRRRSA